MKMENETKVTEGKTSVMVQEEKAVAVDNGMGSLLQMAISQDIDVDKLEKLIELKNILNIYSFITEKLKVVL